MTRVVHIVADKRHYYSLIMVRFHWVKSSLRIITELKKTRSLFLNHGANQVINKSNKLIETIFFIDFRVYAEHGSLNMFFCLSLLFPFIYTQGKTINYIRLTTNHD